MRATIVAASVRVARSLTGPGDIAIDSIRVFG